eukprot:g10225.t1
MWSRRKCFVVVLMCFLEVSLEAGPSRGSQVKVRNLGHSGERVASDSQISAFEQLAQQSLAAQFFRSVGGKCGVALKTRYDQNSGCSGNSSLPQCQKGNVTPAKLRTAALAGGLTWLYNWDGTLIPGSTFGGGSSHSASDVHPVTGAQDGAAYRDNKLFYAAQFWGSGGMLDPAAKNYGFDADGGASKITRVDQVSAGSLGSDCRHILPFVFGQNEPDHDPSAGGAAMTVQQALAEWKVQTRRAYEVGGYKEFVGPHIAYALPARYGSNAHSGSKTWYEEFLEALANDNSAPGFGGFTHWKQTIHYLGYHTYQPVCMNNAGGGLWLTETALGHGSTTFGSGLPCTSLADQQHYLEKILPRYLEDPSVIGIAWFSANSFNSAFYDRDSSLFNTATDALTPLGSKYLQMCREGQGTEIQSYWAARAASLAGTSAAPTCVVGGGSSGAVGTTASTTTIEPNAGLTSTTATTTTFGPDGGITTAPGNAGAEPSGVLTSAPAQAGASASSPLDSGDSTTNATSVPTNNSTPAAASPSGGDSGGSSTLLVVGLVLAALAGCGLLAGFAYYTMSGARFDREGGDQDHGMFVAASPRAPKKKGRGKK